MKIRDDFIDLMEEIDPRHIDEHVKKNTNSKTKRIKSYITAAGIYTAACVAVFLLISVIIGHTGNVQPNNVPGKEPVRETDVDVTTENPVIKPYQSVDELLADTKIQKVIDDMGIEREDVANLSVDYHQIVNGDVYYLFDGVYKNTDRTPIYAKGKKGHDIESFMVTGDYLICEVMEDPNKVNLDLYCYNMKTEEEILVCSDDIYHYDVYDGKIVYLTADSIESINEVKVYSYDPEGNKNTYVCDLPDTLHYICDISYKGGELVITTDARCFSSDYSALCQVTILDMETKELRDLFATEPYIGILIADSDEGYYITCRKRVFVEGLPSYAESEYNGVWRINPRENPVKISDDIYNEIYYVNGKLVGVNGDEVTAIIENTTDIRQ